jgi:fatty-acyl-CoA synthase
MIGAALHTINVRLSAEHLVYTIDRAEDKVIVVNSEMLPILEAIRGRIDTVNSLVLIDEGSSLPATQFRFAGEYEKLLAAATPLAVYPDLDENARGVLPREAVLLKITFAESIEKTGVGKVNKFLLREKYASRL